MNQEQREGIVLMVREYKCKELSSEKEQYAFELLCSKQ